MINNAPIGPLRDELVLLAIYAGNVSAQLTAGELAQLTGLSWLRAWVLCNYLANQGYLRKSRQPDKTRYMLNPVGYARLKVFLSYYLSKMPKVIDTTDYGGF